MSPSAVFMTDICFGVMALVLGYIVKDIIQKIAFTKNVINYFFYAFLSVYKIYCIIKL